MLPRIVSSPASHASMPEAVPSTTPASTSGAAVSTASGACGRLVVRVASSPSKRRVQAREPASNTTVACVTRAERRPRPQARDQRPLDTVGGEVVGELELHGAGGYVPEPRPPVERSGGLVETAPYRDPTLPVDARLDDLLARMTLDEKLAQIGCVWSSRLLADGVFDPRTPPAGCSHTASVR